MKKIWYIGLLSIGLVACSTVGKVPVDDAYYWPDKTHPSQVSQPVQTNQISQQPAPKASPIEYTNVQDTTVTIRIKK